MTTDPRWVALDASDALNAMAPRRDPLVHPRNVAGCCDGHGQVHRGFGALSYVVLCEDRDCMAWRDAGWAYYCGERPAPPTLRQFMDGTPGECCCGNGEAEDDRGAVLQCPVHGPVVV